jgi:hypothetical protein
MTPLDVACIVLSFLALAALAAFALLQVYRRANPKPRPPGSLTTVSRGRVP